MPRWKNSPPTPTGKNNVRYKHGHAGRTISKTYTAWQNMKKRCNDPRFKYHFQRGIKVCDSWLNNFDNFLADMGEKPEGKSLDRINNDGNYEPGNCRWATPSEQVLNGRRALTIASAWKIAEIKVWLSDGFSVKCLAQKYGIAQKSVRLVRDNLRAL